jgi:hypothetical protein
MKHPGLDLDLRSLTLVIFERENARTMGTKISHKILGNVLV